MFSLWKIFKVCDEAIKSSLVSNGEGTAGQMSLYLFDHDVVYQIIFAIFFFLMLVLLMISGIEIYRSQYISGSRRKLNKVRYITGWCVILQCITFTAYYIRFVAVHAVLWNIWIPSWCSAYILLRYISVFYPIRCHLISWNLYPFYEVL